jgi:hypothetical protein
VVETPAAVTKINNLEDIHCVRDASVGRFGLICLSWELYSAQAARGERQRPLSGLGGRLEKPCKSMRPFFPKQFPTLLILLASLTSLGSANPFKGLRRNTNHRHRASSTFLQLSAQRCPPKAGVKSAGAESGEGRVL